MSEELESCPFCQSADCRVIGGPGTKGGPQFWAGCDHCSGRAWGDTQSEAIAAWNRRASPSTEGERNEAIEAAKRIVEAYDAADWRPIKGSGNSQTAYCAEAVASAIAVARALLSSPRVERERALEEAAQIADIYVAYVPATEDGDEAARKIAAAIRSLSPTDKQARG